MKFQTNNPLSPHLISTENLNQNHRGVLVALFTFHRNTKKKRSLVFFFQKKKINVCCKFIKFQFVGFIYIVLGLRCKTRDKTDFINIITKKKKNE